MAGTSPLVAPLVLNVPIGRGCNNRCVFCIDRGRGVPAGATLEEIAGQLARGRSITDAVIFTNAEPTLNPRLVPAVAAARDLGYARIGLITNGRRLADRLLCEALFGAGLDEVTVSIHGPTAEVHDAVTRRVGSFQEALAGLHNLRRARDHHAFKLMINCTLVPENLQRMREMAAFGNLFEVDALNFNVVEPRGRADDEFALAMPRYADVIAAADASGLDFSAPSLSLSRVPACAGGVEWVQEDYHFTHGDEVTHYEPLEGKTKGPPCASCALADRCPGIFSRYAEEYGWGEFVPLSAPDTRAGQTLRVVLGSPGDPSQATSLDGAAADEPQVRALHRQLREGFLRGYRRAELGGADPLLDPTLPAVVAFARKLGFFHVSLATNARAIRRASTITELRRLGVDEVVVLLDLGRQAQEQRNAVTRNGHKQTFHAMALLAQQSVPFAIRVRGTAAAGIARVRELGAMLGASRIEVE